MKIGIVGCGLNSDYHLRFAKTYPGARIVGLVDLDLDRARRVADHHEIPGAFADLAELVKQADPDVVHILTPPKTHFALAKEAIQLGRHVLIEKPMTLNLEDAAALFELARRHRVKLCAMHNHFYDPCMLKARDLIESGRLGRIVNIESHYGLNTRIPAFRDYPAPNVLPWLYELPGSVYHDFLPHPLYVLLEYTGRPNGVKVLSRAHGELPHGLPDEIRVLVDGEQALGTVTISFAAKPHLHVLRIYGTRMMVEVDFGTMTTVVHPTSSLPKAAQKATYNLSWSWQLATSTFRNVWGFLRGKIKPYQGMEILIHRFYDAVSSGGEPPVSEQQALRVVETMDALFKQLPLPTLRFEPIVPADRPYPVRHQEKVLVTGGTGFLGRPLVKRLLTEGYAVRVLARKLASVDDLVSEGAEVCWGDVADAASLEAAFDGVQVVIHAAAGTSGRRQDCETGTLAGTRNVLALCERRKVAKLIYISSCSVYGVADYAPGQRVTEESSLERFPERRGDYSASKQQAESMALEAMTRGTVPIVVLRPGTIFGPDADPLTPMIGLKLPGNVLLAFGDGSLELPLIYVDNLVDVIVKATQLPSANHQVFNVIDTDRITKREYIDKIIRPLHPGIWVIYFPYRLLYALVWLQEKLFSALRRRPILTRYRLTSSQRAVSYDTSKLAGVLGWRQRYTHAEAIQTMIGSRSIGP